MLWIAFFFVLIVSLLSFISFGSNLHDGSSTPLEAFISLFIGIMGMIVSFIIYNYIP